MKHLFKPLQKEPRTKVIFVLIALLVSVSLITRIVLLLYSSSQIPLTISNLAHIFVIGLFFDLVNASYFIIPFVIYLWLIPGRFYNRKWHQYLLLGIVWIVLNILLLTGVSEYFFWDEFNTRFNFIAVDYLIYTTEVLGNIQQSYPVNSILIIILILSALLTFLLRKNIWAVGENLPFKKRTSYAFIFLTIPVLCGFAIDSRWHYTMENAYVNELSGNGLYELFAAYRNNELDYEKFYPHIDNSYALATVKKSLQANSTVESFTKNMVDYHVKGTNEKKLNVVLISVESLSAEFLAHFGNQQNITPFLDSLADKSMIFTNLYATGTRTVRGLEALTLSIPPTPGQSIVRRPNNEDLFTIGSVFKSKGYECKYLYGGYGYFDNMNYFFSHNDYQVVDRNALSDEEIDYENIWGVADENLFSLSLREINTTATTGQNFFVHIMTTSNHRPYTYPEGRIDIPSHSSRAGAVKYTDYALKQFFKEAAKQPWYNNTLFVVTADHCASSAGKTELPVHKYKIPLIIFSPGFIQPQTNDRLMSQIDIAPTILGLLDFSYESKFFGYDLFHLKNGNERAFISTYQSLGYIAHDTLVVLAPKRKPEVLLIQGNNENPLKLQADFSNSKIVKEAISWYQTASLAFRTGALKKSVH